MNNLEGLQHDPKLSGRILENIGIKINLSEIPEYMEYMDYRYNAPWLIIQFRRIFMWVKISQLKLDAQLAVLNKTIEEGYDL